MSFAKGMKTFVGENGLFQKAMSHKLWQNANFRNMGTSIKRVILQVLLILALTPVLLFVSVWAAEC